MSNNSIWIDGDACPKAIKEIIFKAATRTKTQCFMVANHFMALPVSPFIQRIMAEQGFDKADDLIESKVQPFDIVITGDIPLAEACIQKQAFAISPRGERYSPDTIKQKLAVRDFNETMRSSGIQSGGPKPLSQQAINQFANQLDSLLAKNKRGS